MTYVSYSMTYVSYSMTYVHKLQHDVRKLQCSMFATTTARRRLDLGEVS